MLKNQLSKKIKNLPASSGVYLHKNKSGRVIYIGKASNLKNRVKSYFSGRESYTPARAKLAAKISDFEIIKTETEIDALILEATLIKKIKPKYNVLLKDDKNYFFVGITKDEFPRIFITHQPADLKVDEYKLKTKFVGPFTDGTSLKIVLKLLRKIFPYCTCKSNHKRNCVNADIGLCLGFCCNKNFNRSTNPTLYSVGQDKYCSNIKNITEVLKGNKKKILKNFNKKMLLAAKNEQFETANDYKKQIFALNKIFRHSNVISKQEYSENLKSDWQKIADSLKNILNIKTDIKRIEAYDISNINGEHATGSMIVFENGLSNKNEYRRFILRLTRDDKSKPNDYAMLQEILGRRFNHPEWKLPQIILIDGGKGQLSAARKIIPKGIFVMSLAKKEEILFSKRFPRGLPIKNLPQNTQNLLINLRNEAHRFAINLHRKIRIKNLLK